MPRRYGNALLDRPRSPLTLLRKSESQDRALGLSPGPRRKFRAVESLPASIVERMNMQRMRASVHGRASRFRDSSRMARCCGVNPVAVQGGLQENGGLHYLRFSGRLFLPSHARQRLRFPPGLNQATNWRKMLARSDSSMTSFRTPRHRTASNNRVNVTTSRSPSTSPASELPCYGRGREFESRRPRHSFQKSCSDFTQSTEDPKGHVFVPFGVLLAHSSRRKTCHAAALADDADSEVPVASCEKTNDSTAAGAACLAGVIAWV